MRGEIVLEYPLFRDIASRSRCITCNKPLSRARILGYPHEGGIYLVDKDRNIDGRYWIYIRCRRCGYDNALWKLEQRLRNE